LFCWKAKEKFFNIFKPPFSPIFQMVAFGVTMRLIPNLINRGVTTH
jgi:hypothetical protein